MTCYKRKLESFFSNNIIWCFVASAITSFVCHGAMLFSRAIGIDGELAILNMEAFDYQGRPGVHWIRRLFEVNGFNLYATQVITFLFIIIAPFTFLLLYHLADCKSTGSKWTYIPFIIAFISSPYWVTQLYFLNQSIPVTVTLILIPVTCFLIDKCVENLKEKPYVGIPCGLVSVFLVFLMASVYQVQIIVFVMCVCTLYFVKSYDTERKAMDNIKWICANVLTLLLGLLIYYVIIKNHYSDDLNYLGSQIAWPAIGFKAGARNVVSIVRFSLSGASINSKTYLPAFVILFLLSLVNFFGYGKERRIGNRIFLLLVEIVIFMAPFAFPILYGQEVSPRMRYVFPIAEANIIYLLCGEIKTFLANINITEKKYMKIIAYICFVCMIAFFGKETLDLADYCNRFYYTNEFRYEQDYVIAGNVKTDLETYIKENELDRDYVLSHLVFVGKPDIYYNEMCLPGIAVIGNSSWQWDELANMVRYRIYHFMDVCGYGIGSPACYSDGAKIAYHLYFQDYFGESVEDMNVYPYNGYIQYIENDDIGLDYLVVKLGYDWDAEVAYNKAAYTP